MDATQIERAKSSLRVTVNKIQSYNTSSHSAFVVGNGMYIFGGQDGDKDIMYNDLWLLNTSNVH
jgi:hypothetical protein